MATEAFQGPAEANLFIRRIQVAVRVNETLIVQVGVSARFCVLRKGGGGVTLGTTSTWVAEIRNAAAKLPRKAPRDVATEAFEGPDGRFQITCLYHLVFMLT